VLIVRQSTARTVTVGPVLDADGAAVTTAVVGDFKLSKNGGAPAALNASATLTHRATGHYSLALTASDLDTVGQAEVVIDKTTDACPVKEVTVVEEAVYDALFAASAAGYGAAQTGDSFARLGAPANASIAADIAAVEAQTDDIGAAGAGLTDVPWNAAWDAEVQSEVADALAAFGASTLDAAGVRAAVGLAAANLDAQLGDVPTNAELTTALSGLATAAAVATVAGYLDTEVAAILAAVDTEISALTTAVADVPTNAELATALDALPTAAEVVTALGTGSTLTALATQASVDALPTAAATATAVFTTAMTEAYRSAGATATLAQFAYEVLAHLGESSISGTTKTLKMLDGSTTAKTYTLDDATSPTGITETT
jgi:hypothetical protein